MAPQQIFARDMNWLAEGDLVLTILFYERSAEQKISLSITGNTHRNCILVPYSRLDELEEFIRKSVSPVESANTTDYTTRT